MIDDLIMARSVPMAHKLFLLSNCPPCPCPARGTEQIQPLKWKTLLVQGIPEILGLQRGLPSHGRHINQSD